MHAVRRGPFRLPGETDVAAPAPGHDLEIRQIKFNAVCEVLQKTNLTINAIAERCGFSCESHLSYRFKCVFGISIREWRKQNAWFSLTT